MSGRRWLIIVRESPPFIVAAGSADWFTVFMLWLLLLNFLLFRSLPKMTQGRFMSPGRNRFLFVTLVGSAMVALVGGLIIGFVKLFRHLEPVSYPPGTSVWFKVFDPLNASTAWAMTSLALLTAAYVSAKRAPKADQPA